MAVTKVGPMFTAYVGIFTVYSIAAVVHGRHLEGVSVLCWFHDVREYIIYIISILWEDQKDMLEE
jgi:hypothetical protein